GRTARCPPLQAPELWIQPQHLDALAQILGSLVTAAEIDQQIAPLARRSPKQDRTGLVAVLDIPAAEIDVVAVDDHVQLQTRARQLPQQGGGGLAALAVAGQQRSEDRSPREVGLVAGI